MGATFDLGTAECWTWTEEFWRWWSALVNVWSTSLNLTRFVECKSKEDMSEKRFARPCKRGNNFETSKSIRDWIWKSMAWFWLEALVWASCSPTELTSMQDHNTSLPKNHLLHYCIPNPDRIPPKFKCVKLSTWSIVVGLLASACSIDKLSAVGQSVESMVGGRGAEEV